MRNARETAISGNGQWTQTRYRMGAAQATVFAVEDLFAKMVCDLVDNQTNCQDSLLVALPASHEVESLIVLL